MAPYPTEREAASLEYIQSMLGQLRDMAARQQLGMLTYLIEMAYVEAGDIIHGREPSPAGHNGGGGSIQ